MQGAVSTAFSGWPPSDEAVETVDALARNQHRAEARFYRELRAGVHGSEPLKKFATPKAFRLPAREEGSRKKNPKIE